MNPKLAIAEPVEPPPTSAVTRNRIAAFVDDEVTMSALRNGLEGISQTLDLKRGNIRHATKLLQADTEFHSVIADISGVDDPLMALEELAQVCPTDVPVALIGDSPDISFYRAVLQMGAIEYLYKPLSRDMVVSVLRPKLVGETLEINRGGHVVAVCGAQGGAGATSIAVNLALQLAETTKAKVALLDMHLQGGETAVMLGVRPGPGLRIALEDPRRADELFLDRAAIEVNDRVRLVAADEALNTELHITNIGVLHVIHLLRKRFNYVIVDMPVPLTPAIQPVISVARTILVVLEAEVTGLRNARAVQVAVREISGRNRVITVLNRHNRPGGLTLETIKRGLDADPDVLIPDLGRRMTEAVNQGVPAYHNLPVLRRCLAPLVREIACIHPPRKSWLRRWLDK